MLTGLGLRNFKAFGDEMQEAPLSQITLIYGPNSGGKSSIIQALLLLKQSLKPIYGRNRLLESKGEFVDLGSPQSMLHKHDIERELWISVKYRDLELGETASDNDVSMFFMFAKEDAFRYSEDCVDLAGATYKITTNENDLPLLKADISPGFFDRVEVLDVGGEKAPYQYSEEFLPTLAFPELETRREHLCNTELDTVLERPSKWLVEQSLKRERHLRVQGQKQVEQALKLEWWKQRQREESPQAPENRLDLEGMKLSREQIIALTPEIIPHNYERELRLVNYLGPLRSAPQRIYRRSSANDGTTGIRGEYSANILARNSLVASSIGDEVNSWFRRLEIPYDIFAQKLGEASLADELISIELRPLDKEGVIFDMDFTVTLADVGYGINQILPVIIEGVASREGAILCVEQPEIHLHPRLQANIADLMIDTIADENGKRKQWIVETHSELLILRLQRRIREGKISPDDVSVLYVDPNDDSVEGSAIKVLRLGEDSYFKDPWPDGFFDEALKEELQPDDEHSGSAEGVDVLDELFAE